MGSKNKRLKTTAKQDEGTTTATAEIPPPLPANWDRCHAYLESKRRYCRQFPKGYNPNKEEDVSSKNENKLPVYCGNHQHFLEENNGEKEGTSDLHVADASKKAKRRRKRVPCPVDSSHYIFADTIEKHVLVCPGTKNAKQLKEQPFYRHNVNTGGHGSLLDNKVEDDHSNEVMLPDQSATTTEDDSTEVTGTINTKVEWAQRVALRVLSVHQDIFSIPTTIDSATMKDPNDLKPSTSCNIELSQIQKVIPLQDYSQQEIDAGLLESIQDYRIKSGGSRRHIPQLASLMGHLRSIGILPPLDGHASTSREDTPSQPSAEEQARQKEDEKNTDLVLLEMGAGRGMCGLLAAGATNACGCYRNVHLAMVERAGSRSKADTVLRTLDDRVPSTSTTMKQTNNKSSSEDATDANSKAGGGKNKTSNDSPPQAYQMKPTSPYLQLDTVQWSRVVCDLSHVYLPTILDGIATKKGHGSAQNQQQLLPSTSCMPTITQTASAANGGTDHSKQKMIVVIAKHLCGAGTDVALKSLFEIRQDVSAIVMATCCHGICTWNEYVGRDYLCHIMTDAKNFGGSNNIPNNEGDNCDSFTFGPREFDLLRRWSAGTVCEGNAKPETEGKEDDRERSAQKGDEDEVEDDAEDHGNSTKGTNGNFDRNATSTVQANANDNAGVGVAAIVKSLGLPCGVQGLGRASQRLIDYGRREYIRDVILRNDGDASSDKRAISDLSYYVPPDITPQNAVLVAYRRPMKRGTTTIQ